MSSSKKHRQRDKARVEVQSRRKSKHAPKIAPPPIVGEKRSVSPFPIEALGAVLGPAAEAIRDQVQAPLAVCGQSVLAAATLAVQGHGNVKLPTGQVRPLSEYFITVAASGDRKSSCDAIALSPIRKHEEVLRSNHDRDRPRYVNSLAAWKQAIKVAEKAHADNQDALKSALLMLGPAPSAPLEPILTFPEPTFEGLTKLLHVGHPSLGIFAAEGGQFVGGHAMKPHLKLHASTGLSSVWDGEPIKLVQAGTGAVVLPGRRLAIHLMVQPAIASILLADPMLSDQGLLSRFLVVAPKSEAGDRLWHEPSGKSGKALKAYRRRIRDVLAVPLTLASGKNNELAPRTLRLSAKARRRWIKFHDKVEKAQRADGRLYSVKPLINKTAEHAARLAGVLALTRDITADVIHPREMKAGIKLAWYFANEAAQFTAARQPDPKQRLAQQTVDWLTTAWSEPLVSMADLCQMGPSGLRRKAIASDVVKTLVEQGVLRPVKGSAKIKGRRRRKAWKIVAKAK